MRFDPDRIPGVAVSAAQEELAKRGVATSDTAVRAVLAEVFDEMADRVGIVERFVLGHVFGGEE